MPAPLRDPRIDRLVTAYALARGDRLLRRSKNEAPPPEVTAGWALERMGHDPVGALQLIGQIRMPAWQRQAALRLLRPLVTSIPIRAPAVARKLT